MVSKNNNCAISELKKISSNYIMNNKTNNDNNKISEFKNNINTNQFNENIKMIEKNQNNNCVISELKNNLSTNYIMTLRKSNIERKNI